MNLLKLIVDGGAHAPGAYMPLLAICLAASSVAAPAYPQQAAPPAAFASMLVGGNHFRRDPANSKYTILSTYIDRAAAMKGEAPPAGLASFGWFESGGVMLLNYAEYLPSLAQAGARRNVKPSTWPLDPQATPRYMMVCAWPLDDKRRPGKPAAAYGERDDANAMVKKSPGGTLLSVHWTSVPASRAAARFAARDYCGEIAATKKSSAPLWLTTTTE